MAPDPFRFVSRDISDALDHLSDFTAGPKLSDYNSVRQAKVPVSEVLAYDDYSAWGEWEPGSLQSWTKRNCGMPSPVSVEARGRTVC